LELYLNIVELGPGIYGVGAGSWYYFRKPPRSLNFFEGVLLASIIPSSKRYHPFQHPQRVIRRYKKVLSLMRTARIITDNQYKVALSAQLNLDLRTTPFISPPYGRKMTELTVKTSPKYSESKSSWIDPLCSAR
ncbi:MAG: hypothetical protein DRG50_03050, partial [Deltaproteobacteria bacterium]